MAGIILANACYSKTGGVGTVAIGDVPAVAKAESVCLMAALDIGGTADTYVDIYLTDPVTAPTGKPLIFNEPVRYRQPGGNVLLLTNFIITAGQQLSAANYIAGQTVIFTLFNRWLMDA